MNNSTINYGELIKNARIAKRISQSTLAQRLGVVKTTISNYETNYSTPSLEMFNKIADALGYSTLEMLNINNSSQDSVNLQFPRAVQPAADCYIPYFNTKSLKAQNYELQNYMDYYLTLPGFMLNEASANYMCIKMPDNSLNADGIKKNDYIIVRKSSFSENKTIVVARRAFDGEIFVRRFFRDGHIIALMPSATSEEFSVIRTDERNEEYEIIGFVEKILTNSH